MRLRIHCYQGGRRQANLLWSANDPKEVGTWKKEGWPVANQLGKRFKCSVCETEVLCVKAGDGSAICCDKEMEIQEPRPLPSSD